MSPDFGFVHRWVPGEAGAPTLLLLHGTGGDENDLVPLGEELLPGANLLSPRGKVLEHGMPRFFRRLAPGVLDVPDLKARTVELADFVGRAATGYGFDAGRVIAVGLSNGANIAAATLLLMPEVLAHAVLFRPMVPFEAEGRRGLTRKQVLIAAGRGDTMVPDGHTERLAAMLEAAGAAVTQHWSPGGHGLGQGDVVTARDWLATLANTGDGQRSR